MGIKGTTSPLNSPPFIPFMAVKKECMRACVRARVNASCSETLLTAYLLLYIDLWCCTLSDYYRWVHVCVCVCVCVCGVFVRVCCIVNFCYLIIRNAEALLAEIESRDRHYKRILVLLRAHGWSKQCIFHVILHRRFLRLKSGIK